MSADERIAELERVVGYLRARMPVPLAGEFLDTAATAADDVRVRAFGYDDGEHAFGPVKWSPIGGQLPQAGDEAVILERDDGVWQVIAWWNGSQGTGVAQSALDDLSDAVDALDTRVDALEAAAAKTVRGQATLTGAGSQAIDLAVTDNLGSATKRAIVTWALGGSFTTDAIVAGHTSSTTNTTTLRAQTRLGGNIPVGQTVLLNYEIWIP